MRSKPSDITGVVRLRPLVWVAVLASFGVLFAGCTAVQTTGSSSPGASDAVPTTAVPTPRTTDVSPSTTAAEVASTLAETGDTGAVEDEPAADARYVDGDADVIFTQDQVNTFELTLEPEALAFLDADPTAEEWVDGALTFDGETIEGVGIRYKGSIGSFIGCLDNPDPLERSGAKKCSKLSMKVKVNRTEDGLEFYGQRRLNFHAQNLDATLMHERLGYWLYREMGVPAPRSTHVRLIVNGEFVGIFGLTEEIDGRFSRANFDDGTGNVYKEIWPIDDSGEPATPEALLAALETNEDENPSVDLITSFAEEIIAAGPTGSGAVLERWTDVEKLLAHTVVDRTIRHDDGPYFWWCTEEGCAPHNFFWYEDPTSEKVHLVPWDLDLAFNGIGSPDEFGETSNGCEPFGTGLFLHRSAACDPIVGAILSLDEDYERVRNEFVTGPFSAQQIDAQLDAWIAQIAPAVAEADAAHDDAVTVEQWKAELATLRDALQVARSS